VPMVFVMTVTLWALIAQIRHAFGAFREGGFSLNTTTMNGVVGVLLVGLAVALLVESGRALLGRAPIPAETRAS
jgi:carbon starvation protein